MRLSGSSGHYRVRLSSWVAGKGDPHPLLLTPVFRKPSWLSTPGEEVPASIRNMRQFGLLVKEMYFRYFRRTCVFSREGMWPQNVWRPRSFFGNAVDLSSFAMSTQP